LVLVFLPILNISYPLRSYKTILPDNCKDSLTASGHLSDNPVEVGFASLHL